jgi:hypothetical protein
MAGSLGKLTGGYMPTDIMDEFLDNLGEKERKIVVWNVDPFDHTAGSLARQAARDESMLTEKVQLGPITAIAVGKDEATLRERVQAYRDREDDLITIVANEEFESEYLRSPHACVLTEIARLHTLHAQHPIFGILIAAHDEECDACGTNSDEGFVEREQTAAKLVAAIGDDGQRFLVSYAERLLATIRGKMLRSDLRDFLETFTKFPLAVACPDNFCILLPGPSHDYLSWLTRYSYFLRNVVCHASGSCKSIRSQVAEFERTQVDLLPDPERDLYRAQAFILTKGDGHLLFEDGCYFRKRLRDV